MSRPRCRPLTITYGGDDDGSDRGPASRSGAQVTVFAETCCTRWQSGIGDWVANKKKVLWGKVPKTCTRTAIRDQQNRSSAGTTALATQPASTCAITTTPVASTATGREPRGTCSLDGLVVEREGTRIAGGANSLDAAPRTGAGMRQQRAHASPPGSPPRGGSPGSALAPPPSRRASSSRPRRPSRSSSRRLSPYRSSRRLSPYRLSS